MKRTLTGITALALMLLTIPVLADQETCPEAGKVESQVDGDLNDIVLEAGTEVCIKGSTDLVIVTADGTSTLYELLGNGHDVSHYSILETTWNTTTTVPSTTTSTSSPNTTSPTSSTTSTTVPSSTTSSTEPPSTSIPTSSVPTTTAPTGTLEELPSIIIDPLVVTAPAASETLPFTGPEDVGIYALVGLAAAGLGSLLVNAARRRDEES